MTAVLLVLALACGTQDRDAPKPKPATATLAGRVIALDTGKPVRRAVVTIRAAELSPSRTVSTDAEGHWRFTGLPAGRYTISIAKPGFVMVSYGQRRPFEPGTPVRVAAGEVAAKLEIALPRAAAISGRVVDEFGEPMARVRVSAQRLGFTKGRRVLTPVGDTVTTDDLGRFRIYGLSPGDYFLAASPTSSALAEDRHGYVRTLYPSALTVAQATRITLSLGQEAQDIVIAVSPTPLIQISGTAVDSTGAPMKHAFGYIRQSASGWAQRESGREFAVKEGAWTATAVPPGDYVITLQATEARTREGYTARMPFELVEYPITLGTENVEGIALTTAQAGIVTGRVLLEDGITLSQLGQNNWVYAEDAAGIAAAGWDEIQPDGSFRITGLSGQRLFRIDDTPGRASWLLKSVTLNGADITDKPLPTPAGSQVAGVVVTIGRKAAELSGTVRDARGMPTSDYTVVLFAADPARRGPATRFTRTARPDVTGRFTVGNLPAGDYLAATVEYVEPGQQTDPEFLERLVHAATPVSLAEAEKKTLSLKLPAR
jgi:hypothetical protein